MGGDRLHDLGGIGVGETAGKADQLHVGIIDLVDDPPRHMMRALNQIGDRDDIADALAAILPEPGLDHGFASSVDRVWLLI